MNKQKKPRNYDDSKRLVRLPYNRSQGLCSNDTLIMRKRGGGERRVQQGKWWINRNTPVGEDAELMERMPYNGYRWLSWEDLIAVERFTSIVEDKEFI